MNMRQSSKQEWDSSSTVEHINVGSLQRIADGVEKMAGSYSSIISERDLYKRISEEQSVRIKKLKGTIAALRAWLTRNIKAHQ